MLKTLVRWSAAAVGGILVLGAVTWYTTLPDEDPRGTWTAPAYGLALRISALRAEVFRITPVSCFRENHFPAHYGLVKIASGATISTNKDGIELRLDSALEPIRFTTSDLPTECDDPEHRDGGVQHTFDVFWHAMDHHYPFFEVHGVNWKAQKSLAPETNTVGEAELAKRLRDAVAGLDDGHVQLSMGEQGTFSPERVPNWLKTAPALTHDRLWDTALNEADIVVQKVKNIPIRYGIRADGIGYIAIKEMEVQAGLNQSSYDATVQAFAKVAEALQNADALVVDVRYNPGGADNVSMALAGFFTDRTQDIFQKMAWKKPKYSEPFTARLTPSSDLVLTQPTMLLTSELTGSAAEIFTLAMRELPNVTVMGSRTSGGLSDMMELTLPNGWTLGLSSQNYVSMDGEEFEAIGIPPDIEIPQDGGALLLGSDRVLEQTVQSIRNLILNPAE
ncbi:S41 family peptidase [Ruegeria sp. MALMAid1280]|uniref:S41 family peptidase n=1 Tax=Ruegeria sp. MALMAid1280 TaxID=3411634 RepID=UPI003BA0F3D0